MMQRTRMWRNPEFEIRLMGETAPFEDVTPVTTWPFIMLSADLALAIDLARRAALAILAVKSSARSSPQQKADDSPVTEADLAADAVISGVM